MTRLEDITYVDWQPMLNQIGEAVEGIDDINQCIANIIKTRKGSVPHRPTFGSNVYQYVDYPISEAIPNIIREATDSITEWEPRVEIKQMTASSEKEKITLKIEWTLIDSDEGSTAEVEL